MYNDLKIIAQPTENLSDVGYPLGDDNKIIRPLA